MTDAPLPDGWITTLHDRLGATKARIGERVQHEIDERNERIAALAWCRANGNPHRPKP